MIIIDPDGKELDFDILKRAIERNGDGWGMSSYDAEKKEIRVNKGDGFDSAKRAWKCHGGQPRVFHARIGTSGTKDLRNCHPFIAHYRTPKLVPPTDGDTADTAVGVGGKDVTTSGEIVPRWFFHNGTLSIPRILDDYCDSWHYAKYLQAFASDETFFKKVQEYAKRERSRFAIHEGNIIWRFGDGWIERNGFFYSNSSALGQDRNLTHQHGYQNVHSKAYTGGLLDPAHGEVTSDSYVAGFHYDNQRKLYTNVKPVSRVWENGKWTEGASEGQTNGKTSTTNNESNQTRTTADTARTDAASVQHLDGKRGSRRSLHGFDQPGTGLAGTTFDSIEDALQAKWAKEIMEMMVVVPWMHPIQKTLPGFKISYPSAKEFNYGEPGPNRGYTITHRIKPAPGARADAPWHELTFDKGVMVRRTEVSGPYAHGLVITSGEDGVVYNGENMSFDDWRSYVFNHYWPEIFGEEPEENPTKGSHEKKSYFMIWKERDHVAFNSLRDWERKEMIKLGFMELEGVKPYWAPYWRGKDPLGNYKVGTTTPVAENKVEVVNLTDGTKARVEVNSNGEVLVTTVDKSA